MARPGDLPPAERHAHGTRARYVTGCRCAPCTIANRDYARGRYLAQCRGDWNGLVEASKAREHLMQLSKLGVGRRAVQAASDVALTVLEDVRSGKKTRIRARTEKAILEVNAGAMSDGALVPAKETWKQIRKLLSLGYTKSEIAKELGSKAKVPSLQVRKDQVLARTAQAVRRFYHQVMEEVEREKTLAAICTTCGYSHDKHDRQSTLKIILPATTADIKDAWSCFYGGIGGERQLYRDLKEIGATASDNTWRLG